MHPRALLLACSVALSSSAFAQGAPPGRWYTEGGSANRAGASANAPLLRRPVLAWRQVAGGEIVGEPLVWDDHVVLGIRIGGKRAGIEVRRLTDGGLIGQRVLNSTTAPCPALWGNEVIWRVGEGGLERVRIGAREVTFAARMGRANSVGPPLRVGTRLYAAVDGHLCCMRAADFRQLWRSEQNGFEGPQTLAGDTLLALRKAGDAYVVVALAANDGAQVDLSQPFRVARAPGDDARLYAAGGQLLVRLGDGHLLADFRAKGDVALNTVVLSLPLGAAEPRAMAMPLPHAMDGVVDVGAIATAAGVQLGLFRHDDDKGVRLDACKAHEALAAVPPTIVRDVVYFGATAVDLEELQLLWQVKDAAGKPLPATRAVPAGRSLLFAQGTDVLALREDAPVDAIAAELEGVSTAEQRTRLVALCEDAIAAADADLALDLLERCRGCGADETWATRCEKSIGAIARDKKRKPDVAKSAAVRTAADGVALAALSPVQDAVAAWATTRAPADHRAGLRFLLAQQPDHAGATASVRALLPATIQPPEPFLAADWLDFLEATAHAPVTVLEASLDDFGAGQEFDSTELQMKQQLLEWRAKWRGDLQALQSPRLLLFSPITRPGSLAKALATGELVCDALESMFADMPKVRQDPRPMLVFIYPDREEYVEEAKKLGFDASATAGFYSDALNELVPKSRLFVPADDTHFVRVLPTLAHELTHQWLRDRCPAFEPDKVAARVGPKSFWIVEGFASMVMHFEFDLARREFRLGRGHLTHSDVVVSVEPRRLIPWDRLVGMRRIDFDRAFASESSRTVASRLRLGASFEVRPGNLFYAQAAMLTRYLYEAEDGRHRRALMDFVSAYYRGDLDALDFERAFGVKAGELGPKIVAFAAAQLE